MSSSPVVLLEGCRLNQITGLSALSANAVNATHRSMMAAITIARVFFMRNRLLSSFPCRNRPIARRMDC